MARIDVEGRMVYSDSGPAVPNTYAEIDWNDWDRPSDERVEAVAAFIGSCQKVMHPKGWIAALILEHAGRIRRVTQDKNSITWEAVRGD